MAETKLLREFGPTVVNETLELVDVPAAKEQTPQTYLWFLIF